jgi:transmembrane sensor
MGRRDFASPPAASTDSPAIPATEAESRLVTQAAEWIMGLTADDAEERATAAAGFAAWKAADPRHARAAAGLEQLLAATRELACAPVAGPARQALRRVLKPRSRRPSRAAALAIVLALSLPGWSRLPSLLPPALLADLSTGPAQWQAHRLADGSTVTLAGNGALRLHFDGAERRLELLQGEILVQVAPDPERPFVVQTEHGSIRALGTRFVVRREVADTELLMIESRTLAHTAGQIARGAADSEGRVVVAGQRLRLGAEGFGPLEAVEAAQEEADWQGHRLVVQDRPLPEVLEMLARQRRGWLHYDSTDLAGLRVSAVLPLDDPDRALRLLATSFPQLRLRSFTPYYLRLERAS